MPIKSSRMDVDIISQTLSEMIFRPKYGTRGLIDFANYVTPNSYTILGTITGKGILYGGADVAIGSASCANDSLASSFDGGPIYDTPSLGDCKTFNLVGPHGATYQLECYDDVNFYYSAGLQFGITFETKGVLYYHERSGRMPYVVGKIMYAVI